jgi:hypothetical protein
VIRDQEWKESENIPLLEETVRMDERQPLAYCELGYIWVYGRRAASSRRS